MVERFKEDKTTLSDFMERVLVVCPRCGGKAESVACSKETAIYVNTAKRLVCVKCGFNSEEDRGQPGGYQLWLETNCCGETLWAFNLEHLEYIEGYVRADIRKSGPDTSGYYSNRSMASRLPDWIKKAGNRDDVLKCIERLKKLAAKG